MNVICILGNRMNDDGTISLAMQKRLEKGLYYINNIKPNKVIVSGGIANKKAKVSEASAMYDFLISHGVNKDIIILEDKSKTTVENAKFSAFVIKDLKTDNLYILSSESHIKRKFFNPIKLFIKQLKGTNIDIKPLY